MIPSFAQSVVTRLGSKSARENLPYTFGRFASVRRLYGGLLGSLQSAGAVPGTRAGEAPVVEGPPAEERVAAMREDSACMGLRIPPALVAEIVAGCRTAPLLHWHTRRSFHFEDVAHGRFTDGSPAVIADVQGVDAIPAARAVATDPVVLRTLELYMGYRPIGFDLRVLASFASDVSDDTRRAYGQTIDFHFDVHSYNFVYANYYLSDVDVGSGAHVMVTGSHDDKPARWLLGSARRTDAEVLGHYGAERVRVIEGPAGTGFLQDSSCYHKASPTKTRERLMMHVRYY
jgi:hypothetical protein